MNPLIEETRKALSVWRRLSFRIDQAVEDLSARKMELSDRMDQLPAAEQKLYAHLLQSVEEEIERLEEMRHHTPALQYHALMGERVLSRTLRRVQKERTPVWWKFWKGSHAHEVAQGEVKTQQLCKKLKSRARRVLALAPEEDIGEAVRVNRTLRFLYQPLLYQTIRCLAEAQQAAERLVESLDPAACGVSAELAKEAFSLLELVEALEGEFDDLLRQQGRFSLQEKEQALGDLAHKAEEQRQKAERLTLALSLLRDSELDRYYMAATAATDERMWPHLSAVESEIRDWIEERGTESIERWCEDLRAIAEGRPEVA